MTEIKYVKHDTATYDLNKDLLNHFATSTAAATAEFDALGIPAMVLDSTAALHKSKVGGKLRRSKPSKDHLKTMGSMSNLIDETTTEPRDHTPTISEPPAVADTPHSHPVPKPRPRPKKTVAMATDSKKPQAAPRQKSEDRVVTSPIDSVEIAQVESLVKPDEETSPKNNSATKNVKQELHESPSLAKKPHPSPSFNSSPDISKPAVKTPLEVANDEPHKAHYSPLPKRKEPMKVPSPKPSPSPSPKHFPKPSPRVPSKDIGKSSLMASKEDLAAKDYSLNPREDASPIAASKPSKQLSHESSAIAEPQTQPPPSDVDPSQTAFKEKLALARGQAAISPARIKFPPPPSKKPSDQHIDDQNREPSFRRTKSFDNELEASPCRKKLPIGGVNVMGNLGFPGLVSHDHGPVSHDHGLLSHDNEQRERSLTVSTSEPGERERNSLKRHLVGPGPSFEGSAELDSHNETDDDAGDTQAKPHPPKRPPPPAKVNKPPLVNDHQQRVVAGDGFKGESPPVITKYNDSDVDSPELKPRSGRHDDATSKELNYNEVLTWTPDHVGAWLRKIGLGQYHQIFIDRVIQGYMLFDLDGHRLKVRGCVCGCGSK